MTWASLAVRMGGLALLLPLVLTRLQTAEMLVWQMLSAITLLVALTDFGFLPTFSRLIAYARGGGTLEGLSHGGVPGREGEADAVGALELPALIRTQRIIYRWLIPGVLGPTVVLGTWALWRPMQLLEQPAGGWAAWLVTIVAGQIVLLNGSQVAILIGFDEIASTRRRDAVIALLQLATTCGAVLITEDLFAVIACYSLWQAPLYLLNRRSARQLLGSTMARLGAGLDKAVFARVWPAAWRSGVAALMTVGIVQASGLVYAQVAPAAAAASFLLALRLMTALSQLSQAPFYSRLPALARLYGQDRRGEALGIACNGMAKAHWAFVIGALAAVTTAPFLLRSIGSSVGLPDYPTMTMLTLAMFAERYGAMHIQLSSLTNRIVWHVANGVTGLLMILLFAALYLPIGTAAIPAAMLGGNVSFYAPYCSHVSFSLLPVKRWSFERSTALQPLLLLLVVLAAQGLLIYIPLLG